MPKMFSSEKEQEILKLESRRKIYNLVKQFSGCNFHDLERKSSIPTSTLQYHLHYLAKYGLITMQKDGNKIRYFAHYVPAKDKTLLTLLRQKTIRHILLFILNHKECRQQDIIHFLGLSPSTVSWHLSRLVEHRVLEVIIKKREACYRLLIPIADIISLLITYKESFFDTLVDQTIEMWSFR